MSAEYNSINAGLGFVNISLDTMSLNVAKEFVGKSRDRITKAISLAVNRSLESYKTTSLRETAAKYFIKQKDIREALTVKKSYGGSYAGAVIARGHRQPLTAYNISPRNKNTKMGELLGAVKKAGGLKHGKTFTLVNGHALMFDYHRKRWSRITSPSVPQLMKNKDTMAEAEKKARETFEKRLSHEVERALKLTP